MATRRPLVQIAGAVAELPAADSVDLGIFGSGAAGLFLATPAVSSGVPSFRSISISDVFSGPQTANYLFAGPVSGAAAAPGFRAMVTADLGTTLTPQFARIGLGAAPAYAPIYVVGANNTTTAYPLSLGGGTPVNYYVLNSVITISPTAMVSSATAGSLNFASVSPNTTGSTYYGYLNWNELAAGATTALSGGYGLASYFNTYAAVGAGSLYGYFSRVFNYGTATTGNTLLQGGAFAAGNVSVSNQTTAVTTVTGLAATAQNATKNGTVGTMNGFIVNLTNAGTISTALYGIEILPVNTGTITPIAYGLYISGFGTGGTWSATPYDIYAADAGALNYFAGNVGIGTATPIGTFDVRTKADQHVQILDDTNGKYPGAAGIVSINDASSGYTPLGFYASNFYFGGGNVGIGTASPGSKLSIVGLPTSTAGLSSGDIWVDTTGGLNILKIV